MNNTTPEGYEFTPFTREEEHELFIRFREEGCQQAKEQLCLSVIKMMRKQVGICVSRGHTPQVAQNIYDEIFSLCLVALTRALSSYDHNSGNRFSTYVNWAVTNTIRTFFNRRKRDLEEREHSNCAEELMRTGNRKRVNMRRAKESAQSAKIAINEDALSAYHNVDRKADTETLLNLLGEDIGILDARARKMVHMRFVEGKTCKEIAAKYQLSKVRIEQIIDRGMQKVRDNSENRSTYIQVISN